ncbi:DUF961 family protein [Lactococcus ileimucosae]|uniref:DUF961 family protein n=1 Tax=Lactococcus ileimucosae TaxID=2941329 RepID=UPI00204429B6|nr:DUF961 family protein [Lactococcus ileimucosae]
MVLKLSKDFTKQNELTEEFGDFDKGLGKLLFLSAEAQLRYEDYEAEEGEIKRRPTDEVDYYEVKLYSEAMGEQIEVKMPADTAFDGLDYEDEVKLVHPSAFFWSEKELSVFNGQSRVHYYDGVKFRAEKIEKVGKSAVSTPNVTAKSEDKSEKTPEKK